MDQRANTVHGPHYRRPSPCADRPQPNARPTPYPGPVTTQFASAGKVLVVDDDEAVRVLLTRYLELEGYTVSQVRDGADALAAIASTQPDLVLLDLMLPAQ